MARITLDAIRHSYSAQAAAEQTYALKRVDLVFDDGGAYALLGPSGCGKTTLLNIMSGLVRPSEGRVLFDERDVTALRTEDRNIAQVFQFPVIYDTMTVRENIAFPLRNRRVKGPDLDARVADILKMIGLEHRASRRARGLTADEKQKVSLGRGLVRADVSAILFDEPLTVIDPHLKWELRTQLKALHRDAARTMVYVTHDQTEALTFADRVAVMYNGEIVQVGTPEQLFAQPAHTFVGDFIGSPGMNLMPVTLDGACARLGGLAVPLPRPVHTDAARIELGVRPEHVRVGREGHPAQLVRVEDAGRLKIVRARIEGRPVAAIVAEDQDIPAEPRLAFDPQGVHIFGDGWRIGTGARP